MNNPEHFGWFWQILAWSDAQRRARGPRRPNRTTNETGMVCFPEKGQSARPPTSRATARLEVTQPFPNLYQI